MDLAHDKITVNQYIHRLVIYGYFYLHNNGLYEFVRMLPEGQTSLDPRIIRHRLQASLAPKKKIPKRNY